MQIGTLGGGNHFIELDKCEESGEIYLIIHTGSRNFGKQIAEFWQNKAEGESVEDKLIDTNKLIADLKKENRHIELKEDKSERFLLKHKYLNRPLECYLNIHKYYIKNHNKPILSYDYNTRAYIAELTEDLIEELKELYKTDFNEFEKIEVK